MPTTCTAYAFQTLPNNIVIFQLKKLFSTLLKKRINFLMKVLYLSEL